MDHCDGLSPSSQRLKEVNDRWVKECTALDSFADCAVLPNGISCDVERKVSNIFSLHVHLNFNCYAKQYEFL